MITQFPAINFKVKSNQIKSNQIKSNQIKEQQGATLAPQLTLIPFALLLSRPLAHLEVITDTGNVTEVDTVVGEGEDLVDHGLVVPLHKEGRDGVVAAVEDDEQWWHIRPAELKQLRLLIHPPLYVHWFVSLQMWMNEREER